MSAPLGIKSPRADKVVVLALSAPYSSLQLAPVSDKLEVGHPALLMQGTSAPLKCRPSPSSYPGGWLVIPRPCRARDRARQDRLAALA